MTRRAGRWVWLLPASYFLVLFAYPLGRIVWTSFTLDGRLDLSAFVEVATRGSLRSVVWFTLWQAFVSTGLTLLVAMPGAFVLARYEFPGRRLLSAAVTVPFVLPTVVVGTAYLALLGPRGPLGIDLRQTAWAILIAHVFFNYAVVVRTVGGVWRLLDPSLEEAAMALGATRWRAFRTTTLPLLAPSIAAAASIVFLFTFTSFGVVLILGGFSFATLEVAIWREATINLDLAVSAALAILQLIGVGGSLIAYARYQARRSRHLVLRAGRQTARRPQGVRQRAMIAVVLGTMVVYLGAPIAVLVGRSASVRNYTRLLDSRFVDPAAAIWNSLWFAMVATVLSLVIGLAAAVAIARRPGRAGSRLDTLLMLPLGTSAVTIGLGFLVAFDWPFDLRTSPWLIPVAHSLVAVPFVIRTTVPVLRSIRARLREAAAALGATPRQVFREVELPIMSRAMLVGGAFAFAVSLGEFGATAFLVRPDRQTIPTAIFRLLGQPGRDSFGQAMALATVLMLVTTLVIMAIDRYRVAGIGEF